MSELTTVLPFPSAHTTEGAGIPPLPPRSPARHGGENAYMHNGHTYNDPLASVRALSGDPGSSLHDTDSQMQPPPLQLRSEKRKISVSEMADRVSIASSSTDASMCTAGSRPRPLTPSSVGTREGAEGLPKQTRRRRRRPSMNWLTDRCRSMLKSPKNHQDEFTTPEDRTPEDQVLACQTPHDERMQVSSTFDSTIFRCPTHARYEHWQDAMDRLGGHKLPRDPLPEDRSVVSTIVEAEPARPTRSDRPQLRVVTEEKAASTDGEDEDPDSGYQTATKSPKKDRIIGTRLDVDLGTPLQHEHPVTEPVKRSARERAMSALFGLPKQNSKK